MKDMTLSPEMKETVRKAQIDEETGAILYGYLGRKQKDEKNRKVFSQMSSDEKAHAAVWKGITGEDVVPKGSHILFLKILTVIFGFTFVVKMMQKDERVGRERYGMMCHELPQAARMLEDERSHENILYNMLDEERLHYVGAMVLGLNDALVELTGAIAGVTFALANSHDRNHNGNFRNPVHGGFQLSGGAGRGECRGTEVQCLYRGGVSGDRGPAGASLSLISSPYVCGCICGNDCDRHAYHTVFQLLHIRGKGRAIPQTVSGNGPDIFVSCCYFVYYWHTG
jgi:hypothetical protein